MTKKKQQIYTFEELERADVWHWENDWNGLSIIKIIVYRLIHESPNHNSSTLNSVLPIKSQYVASSLTATLNIKHIELHQTNKSARGSHLHDEDFFHSPLKKNPPNFWAVTQLVKRIYILTNRGIHIKLNLAVPYKIQGANKGGRLSDFSAQPPTSCRNINSNVSLWLRWGKTPCVLVLCGGHVAIGGCVLAALA